MRRALRESPPNETPWKGVWLRLSLAAMLAGASSAIAGSVWLGTKLMVDPDGLHWLSKRLPTWTDIALDSSNAPQTLDEIRTRIRASGRIPAEPVSLTAGSLEGDLLFPVLKERPSPCDVQCRQIVELQVYQRLSNENSVADGLNGDRGFYYLADRVAVSGPPESFAIAPLVDAKSVAPGSTRPLPLTNIQRLTENAPPEGVWLNLIGERPTGDTQLTYGQVFLYNRDRYHLSLMLQWSSPSGQLPYWQDFTGGGTAEFVVERTLGLEPDFEVYRLQPRNFLLNPVQLQPISLNEAALDSRTYKNALLLARSGLWSPAQQILESIRQESGTRWTPDAQAQLDTIAFHADVTRTQARASWASPNQKVLAALLDGRWTQGLETLEAHLDGGSEMVQMLAADTNRLWRRIDAAVRVNPTDEDAIVWGVLVLALQQDRPRAIAWLREQENVSPETFERCVRLLNRLQLGNPQVDEVWDTEEDVTSEVEEF
ncbi:hypothetical protein [Baaleninema simplex]|uniref:hypothetical protein n=1 Tax=Baaleninema simplex TaxID=2862350 RepID=UPI000346616F|nr:hypothetical protein [Baaleninema simplex]